MNNTRREYLRRINFILDLIEENLDADLSLEYLSKEANYSPYHFHRVFLTVVNERVNEFIIRKRIERIASILLVKSHVSLSNLAYTYGFNSDTAFSRAFKKYYGVSPTEFKSQGKEIISKIGIESFSLEKYICCIDNIKQWIKMNAQITIKELPEMKLASLSDIGNFENIGGMFQKLMQWGAQKEILDTSNFKALTIYHDNPNVTQSSKVRFSTCVTISDNINTEGEIRQRNLKKGIYAIGHFEIKTEEISNAWNAMCVWVIENNYEFRDGDYFEMYHNDPQNHPEQKAIIEIGIPLERTENIQFEVTKNIDFSSYDKQDLDYNQLISYMKSLRLFFHKEYDTQFKLGNVYQGNPAYSYFSLTTEELEKLKLKFVIILNHKQTIFSICLSGQNKDIRKKYWQMFKYSDWNRYHIVESIDDSLEIINHIITKTPDFSNGQNLMKQIEIEALKFIHELSKTLE
ncbi:GyrI-like domain-containing protein [Myroides sp. N17-2]|uniref:AraC family transcriptional regulator n=1 Tax=Myroides sp. N17-2 TaxID=2030799 RepID=UPI000EFD71EB|nr:AraC family transcriptional regulator [Myroides sp. N17-2]